jgi:hypothetical protein
MTQFLYLTWEIRVRFTYLVRDEITSRLEQMHSQIARGSLESVNRDEERPETMLVLLNVNSYR